MVVNTPTKNKDEPVENHQFLFVFRRHGDQKMQFCPLVFLGGCIGGYPNLPEQHKKVIDAIVNCRSGNFSVTVYRCQGRGKLHHIDRFCGNRQCPGCQYRKSRDGKRGGKTKKGSGQANYMLTRQNDRKKELNFSFEPPFHIPKH